MHPNPIFRNENESRNLEFIRHRAFGSLAVNGDNGPLVSHVPFQISNDASFAELHLVRSNPIMRLLKEPQLAVLAVTGGDAYISPDWYGVDDQVPTWNYVAVHIRGTLQALDHENLDGVLRRLSAGMEERLLPKKPWTSEKMDEEVYLRMKRQIVPVGLTISSIDGTWKLSQNKPEEVRLAASDGLDQSGFGSEVNEISALMRQVKQG
ncbi:MAG: FMN-binding negative transcriptional regulator [Pseudomonadota bacterium]